MKFVYKIHSGYDGFQPRRIPERLRAERLLPLGWLRYLDAVEEGWDVWVYFLGPHSFEPGVYIKGTVQQIDLEQSTVWLRVDEHRTDRPLTHAAVNRRIAELLKRYQQVFIYPTEWESPPQCNIASTVESCVNRRCHECSLWSNLRRIDPNEYSYPPYIFDGDAPCVAALVPAYWVIPARCYLKTSRIAASIQQTDEIFERFKFGEERLAYPLALGMFEAMREQGFGRMDALVPIPLSPNKEAAGELHRTRRLAQELARLLDAEVVELLRLRYPISKRAYLNSGHTPSEFHQAYCEALEIVTSPVGFRNVLLIDDACTHGHTLRAVTARLRDAGFLGSLFAATAGQMILKGVVRDESGLVS
jgi:predicted amidophosphoribosyltransferase